MSIIYDMTSVCTTLYHLISNPIGINLVGIQKPKSLKSLVECKYKMKCFTKRILLKFKFNLKHFMHILNYIHELLKVIQVTDMKIEKPIYTQNIKFSCWPISQVFINT